MQIEIDDQLLLALCRPPDKRPEKCGVDEDVRSQVEFCSYEHIRKLDNAGKLDYGSRSHLKLYQKENKEFIRARKADKLEEEITMDNNNQDLDTVKAKYESLQNELVIAWAQYNSWKDRKSALEEQLAGLDNQKKQYVVRVYQEVYYDFEVDAFDEKDAVAVALESAPCEDMEICEHFASTPPRVKVLCLKENYKEEMEKHDE